MKTQRIYLQNHEPLKFKFQQNKDDFIVDEIPLESFTNSGNFFILKIYSKPHGEFTIYV